MGSLLWVTWPAILQMAAVYAVAGRLPLGPAEALPHHLVRARDGDRQGLEASGWWDFWFYLSFGVVITFSVPIAGVLLVFSFLVVPAAVAFQFTRHQGYLAVISWIAGVLASALGIWISFKYDLPTGPVVVCVFGLALLLAWATRRFVPKSAPA